jgi:hypothetical protein
MLTFGFNCVCVNGAHAMWKGISRFWEDVKREATNAAHNTESEVGKAWEDTKREATVFAHSDAGKVIIKSAVGGAVSLAGYPAASGFAQELVGQIK